MSDLPLQPGDALILVDVQNDFCPDGALPVAGGDEIVPVLNRRLAAARDRGALVIASRDWHPADHCSFREQGGPWPRHCVQDSRGAQFHPGLQLPDDVVVVSKGCSPDRDAYSAFEGTGLDKRLREQGVRRLWIGGLALDVCVRATALDACRLGFEVHLLADATRPVDPEAGRQTLAELRQAGAIIEREGDHP